MARKIGLLALVVCTIVITAAFDAKAEAHAAKAKPVAAAVTSKGVNPEECYQCHETIQDLHKGGKHAKVNCISCHAGLVKHLADPGPETRPETDVSWDACGRCHERQYRTFMKEAYHRPGRDEKSQLTGRAPNPFWDKLMMGHGFTKEHDTTRSHNWMLIDHLVVDRAYGGRFQGKKGWNYLLEKGKAWDVLKDMYPDSNEQKAFIRQSAAAANPVCLQCKTQDNILRWGYMGNQAKGAEWSRKSNVIELAWSSQYGLNCFYCHDPHAAKPRIVRDALIEALTRPDGDTLWHKDPKHTNVKVIDMGLRGFTRKIALLDKYDTRLQCGQCHVEYNCNPGYDPKNGDASKYSVTMDDPRTNHFPYQDVLQLYDHYVGKVSFLDFKHGLTGGLLWKAQHPEAETYYNSVHSEAGVGCDDCHMPKIRGTTGVTFTSHFAVTPRVQLKETCLTCHKQWTEEQARYSIDSIKAHIRGKMRKAEFWLSILIDRIGEAKNAGAATDAIKEAQDQHLRAHILWEYWTAENSDGFHNPALARESLTKSVDESKKGIEMLKKAMAEKVTAK
jgi:nitrite reductase (cytochrome c-552)